MALPAAGRMATVGQEHVWTWGASEPLGALCTHLQAYLASAISHPVHPQAQSATSQRLTRDAEFHFTGGIRTTAAFQQLPPAEDRVPAEGQACTKGPQGPCPLVSHSAPMWYSLVSTFPGETGLGGALSEATQGCSGLPLAGFLLMPGLCSPSLPPCQCRCSYNLHSSALCCCKVWFSASPCLCLWRPGRRHTLCRPRPAHRH